ncbi:hypothetical protein BGZ76_001720 [Entomortierella beljakovae]|nr:hypothetical protein BGZ76_001720 [Entomortierella beljakovae]
MSLQGINVEALAKDSEEFQGYSQKMNYKLIKLYKITYIQMNPLNLPDSFGNETYFHGTGHCGCLWGWARSHQKDIKPSEWCNDMTCATRGILCHGHLKTATRGQGRFGIIIFF